MRIAILTNSYPPDSRGGSGQIAKLQADWFISKGHEVRVWVPAPFSDVPNNEPIKTFKTQTSIPFPEIAKHNPLSRLFFHIEDLSPNASLVEEIRSYNPDVLLTHNLTGCGWGTPDTLRKAGIRWVHVLHDVQMIEPSGQIFSKESLPALRSIWRKYWAKKRSKTFGSPDTIITPSNWLLTFHKQFNLFQNSKTTVVPNPILKPNPNRAQLDEPLTGIELSSTNHEFKIVLYVGRVSKDKGVENLIEAWSLFKQKIDVRPSSRAHVEGSSKFDVRLRLVGDGPYLQEIKKLNDPTIECLGALDHSELAKYYAEASIFVFPSLLMENQPTVLLEAVSHGLNIVASDIGGVGELLRGYGTLVPPADSAKLADAINTEITNKPNLALGQEILSRHDMDKVMDEYLKNLSL
ncbi:MAG: glycosyltransferase family 4 protein [Patescibacteria group bacterium]|nr:glycosyltransferase family 4 protein [Patescibacteria group bacterium]